MYRFKISSFSSKLFLFVLVALVAHFQVGAVPLERESGNEIIEEIVEIDIKPVEPVSSDESDKIVIVKEIIQPKAEQSPSRRVHGRQEIELEGDNIVGALTDIEVSQLTKTPVFSQLHQIIAPLFGEGGPRETIFGAVQNILAGSFVGLFNHRLPPTTPTTTTREPRTQKTTEKIQEVPETTKTPEPEPLSSTSTTERVEKTTKFRYRINKLKNSQIKIVS